MTLTPEQTLTREGILYLVERMTPTDRRLAVPGGMVRFAGETDAGEVIVATEMGLLYRLRKESPEKTFIPASPAASCKNMKRNTAEKILWCLEDMRYEVRVDPEVRERARGAIDAMVAAREAGKGVLEGRHT